MMRISWKIHHAVVVVLLIGPSALIQAEADTGAISHPHDDLACARCHAAGARAETSLSGAGQFCKECHARRGSRPSGRLGFHQGARRDCLGCHSYHETDRLTVRENEFSLAALKGQMGGHCLGCHGAGKDTPEVSPGHAKAADLYHAAGTVLAEVSPSDACQSCHSGKSAPGFTASPAAAVPINLHASHPLGIRVQKLAGTGNMRIRADRDPRLPLVDGRIECVTCHDLGAGNNDLLVAFDKPYDLCLGCHVKTGTQSDLRVALAEMGAGF